jgi:hypothetical protein
VTGGYVPARIAVKAPLCAARSVKRVCGRKKQIVEGGGEKERKRWRAQAVRFGDQADVGVVRWTFVPFRNSVFGERVAESSWRLMRLQRHNILTSSIISPARTNHRDFTITQNGESCMYYYPVLLHDDQESDFNF